MTDASYRSRVEQDFQQKKALMPQGELFTILDDASLSTYEQEALEFLYAYMPLADITDYPGEFHLMNIRASQRATEEMPWGKTIPEDLFRHFVLPVRVNKQVISPAILSTVLAFSFIYAVIIIVSVLLMLAMGVGFTESIGTVISSIGNMGPGLGSCGPAYSWDGLPDLAKWLLSFLMLLGRLELFTVLLLFSSDFWKRN